MFDLLSHFISSVTCILKGDPKGQSVCLELDKFFKYWWVSPRRLVFLWKFSFKFKFKASGVEIDVLVLLNQSRSENKLLGSTQTIYICVCMCKKVWIYVKYFDLTSSDHDVCRQSTVFFQNRPQDI